MSKKCHLTALLVAILLLLSFTDSRADTELSLYTGETSISDTNFDVYYYGSGSVTRHEHFDATSLKGIRLTHWGDDVSWLGLTFDLSSFSGRSDTIDLRVMPLSTLLLFRASLLRSTEFPRGTLHPYLGIGPSLVYYRYSLDFGPAIGQPLNVTGGDVGWTGSSGVTWQFSKYVGLFAEYRYMKFSINDEEESMDWLLGFPSVVTYRVRADIDTQHYSGGLSFFF